jgi:hypothetical protein
MIATVQGNQVGTTYYPVTVSDNMKYKTKGIVLTLMGRSGKEVRVTYEDGAYRVSAESNVLSDQSQFTSTNIGHAFDGVRLAQNGGKLWVQPGQLNMERSGHSLTVGDTTFKWDLLNEEIIITKK